MCNTPPDLDGDDAPSPPQYRGVLSYLKRLYLVVVRLNGRYPKDKHLVVVDIAFRRLK